TLSDNRFEIVASQLKSRTDEWLDFEAESSINLTITASDAGGLEVTKSFTIIVTNVNDAPTAIRVSTGAIRERIAGEAVGSLSAVDQDAGQSHTFTIVSDARFEIVGSTLKLKADEFLELSDAASLSVDVSTTDDGTPPLTFSQTLLLNVVTNTHPWQNPTDSLNTNNDPAHAIAPIDALLIINLLNDPGTLLGPGSRLPVIRPANMPYFDTNGDNSATPLDALIVINFLNGMPSGEAESAIDVFSPRFNFNALPPTYTSQVFTLSNPPKTMDTVVTEPDACQIAHDSLSQSSNRGVRRALELENVLADIAADVVRARTYLGCELTNPDPTSSGNPTAR
ncbi:MAG: dockerin type I domain-containing protein, partial [Pirellulales bacterium]